VEEKEMQMLQERLELLFKAVGDADRIVILSHNDPDPDVIASAVALRFLLAETLGVESRITYKGIIGRAENRALERYLGHPLQPLTDSDLRRPVPIALVDTQPGAGNNALLPGLRVAIVIDHHPRRDASAAALFADVRPDIGATSTMLTEYLQAAGLELAPQLATALFYGIKTDTLGLSRGAGPADAAAYSYLQPKIDVRALGEIEHAQVPAGYFRSFDAALRAVRVHNGIVTAYLGPMDYPDLAAEMADILSRLQQSKWVICMGVLQGVLFLAVRTRSLEAGAGHLVQAIVGRDGTAGGHGPSAGGQVPLQGRDPEQVARQLSERALRVLRAAPESMPGEPLI
jgi:nanoRNase/pAp phosphatase (c-di-AMP/oligoRNAs hydrolase)